MKRLKLIWTFALLATFGLALQGRADSIINNFTTSQDYIANGIIGDTNWDGVYLRFGDIPGGNNGGDGNGVTSQANTTYAGGYLTIQGTGGSWAGAGDDGFFLYKVVSGDFDASVQIANPFNAPNYHLPGLLARAWNTNLSGSPYAPTSTNGPSENWMYNARFQEFSISEHGRYVTNGADFDGYFNTAGDDADTNSTRYVRITRVGDVFSFYEKTNQSDAWSLIANLPRPDLAGVSMQVGIEDNVGTTANPQTFLTDFELSGPNVSTGTPTLPGAPSAIITTATNISGSLTLSWTLGTPGDSSLVVVRRGGNIQINPVQGLAYHADPVFGASDALMGAGQSVVYSGTGNSVTVTNLSANVFNYTVAVYEYTNTGTSIIYNTAAPTTNVFAGPGQINSVNLTAASTNIPVNGATSLRLVGNFSTGESNFDETSITAWNSSDPTIASVDANGTVSGLASGQVTITGTFGTFTPTVVVNVTAPFAFSDNFTSTNDYVANGLVGSPYDGLFLNFGDVPGTINAGNDGAGFTVTMDSQITDTNGLYLSSVQSDWEAANDDGPFLYKIVPGANQGVSGDFQASVHINNMNTLNGVVAGIMARLYTSPDHSRGPNRENHVNYWKVQNGSTSVRYTQVATNTTLVATGPSAADGWLLIQRANSTNFYFYERPSTNNPWTFTTNLVLVTATNNAPMEVGVAQQSTAGVNGVTTFDSFSVDAPGMVSATPLPPPATGLTMTLNPGDLSMTLNWVAADGSGNPVPSIVVMRRGAAVSAQPPVGASLTGNSVFGLGSNLGASNYVVFVSANPPASTNNTVTVTGLTSGQLYYANVYTYAGSGASTVINPFTTASDNLIDAAITNIATSVLGGIPQGGIGTVMVQGITSTGDKIPISTAGATYVSDNTNVIKILAGVLTGITNGSANVTTVLGPYTSTIGVVVRPPSFTDEFTAAHDYLVDGVTNSTWDGLYNPSPAGNPIPGSTYVPLAGSGATEALVGPVTNIVTTTNIVGTVTNVVTVTNVANALTMLSSGDGWENNNSGGFFVFKYVPANFQVAVHIFTMQVAAYNQPGLLARAYMTSNGIPGYPLGYAVTNAGGTNDAGEYWIDLTRFDEFGIGTYARRDVDSVVSQNTQSDPAPGDTNLWLLIIRSGDGSQFDFYKRANLTDAWKQVPNRTHYSIPQLAGKPMQVGLMAGAWDGANAAQRQVSFEHFLLDVLPPSLTATGSNGNVNVTWPTGGAFTLQATPTLNPPLWQNVTAALTSTNGIESVTVPITNSTEFFRLSQ